MRNIKPLRIKLWIINRFHYHIYLYIYIRSRNTKNISTISKKIADRCTSISWNSNLSRILPKQLFPKITWLHIKISLFQKRPFLHRYNDDSKKLCEMCENNLAHSTRDNQKRRRNLPRFDKNQTVWIRATFAHIPVLSSKLFSISSPKSGERMYPFVDFP